MKILPALATVFAVVVVLSSAVQGDWGVVIIGTLICAVALSSLLSRRNQPPPPHPDDEI